jgi:hypothetical protein
MPFCPTNSLNLFTYLPLSVILSPMPKYYTPREANHLLEIVRPMVGELMEIVERVREHQPEIWAMVEKSAGNGGNPALSKILPDFDRLDAILHRLQDMDIEVKDLSIGLIDFPGVRDGRLICLCWKYGEGSIQFWHEIEAGFAGRQLIDWE